MKKMLMIFASLTIIASMHASQPVESEDLSALLDKVCETRTPGTRGVRVSEKTFKQIQGGDVIDADLARKPMAKSSAASVADFTPSSASPRTPELSPDLGTTLSKSGDIDPATGLPYGDVLPRKEIIRIKHPGNVKKKSHADELQREAVRRSALNEEIIRRGGQKK